MLDDGRIVSVEVMQAYFRVRTPGGLSDWQRGMTWYLWAGMEFTRRDDGTLVSDESPGLVLTPR